MGLTGNLYLGWNMSGTEPLDSLTVTGQLTGCTEAIPHTSWPVEIHFGGEQPVSDVVAVAANYLRGRWCVFPCMCLMLLCWRFSSKTHTSRQQQQRGLLSCMSIFADKEPSISKTAPKHIFDYPFLVSGEDSWLWKQNSNPHKTLKCFHFRQITVRGISIEIFKQWIGGFISYKKTGNKSRCMLFGRIKLHNNCTWVSFFSYQ